MVPHHQWVYWVHLLLLFFSDALKAFWVVSRFARCDYRRSKHLSKKMAVFASPIPVIVYVVGCILAYHLLHGGSKCIPINWMEPILGTICL